MVSCVLVLPLWWLLYSEFCSSQWWDCENLCSAIHSLCLCSLLLELGSQTGKHLKGETGDECWYHFFSSSCSLGSWPPRFYQPQQCQFYFAVLCASVISLPRALRDTDSPASSGRSLSLPRYCTRQREQTACRRLPFLPSPCSSGPGCLGILNRLKKILCLFSYVQQDYQSYIKLAVRYLSWF